MRDSSGMGSCNRRPNAPSVAIETFLTYFSAGAALPTRWILRASPSPLRSVDGPEHGGQRCKVHPSLALGHGLCVKLLRLRAGSAGLLFLDQVDKCLRSFRTHTPHGGYSLRAAAERLFRCERIFIRNHCGRSARPAEEIAERARIKALEPVGRLLLERAQRPDVFFDRGANSLRVATAGRGLDIG